uniref:BZIP domain-containing protein n=1 Tax=Auxenochlorella protothecoides TaxID=3075 RepID=A0A1D2A6I0_AUXPR
MHTLFGDDISERHMGVKGAIEPELPSNDMGPPLPMMHIDQHFLDLDLMSVADLPDPSRLPASGQRHSYLLPSDLTGFMYAEPGADFSAIAQLQAEVAAKTGGQPAFSLPSRIATRAAPGRGPPAPSPRAAHTPHAQLESPHVASSMVGAQAHPAAAAQRTPRTAAEALMHGDLLALLGGAPGATASSGLPASSVSALVRGSLSDGTSGSTHATDSHGADCLAAAGSMFGDPAASDGPDPVCAQRAGSVTGGGGCAGAGGALRAGLQPRPSGRPRQKKEYDALIDPDLPPEQVRRMRRMLSNRESARRSRRRRQTQVSGLEEELDGVRAQVARLSAELERSNSIAQHAMMERAKAVSELEAMRAQFARTSVEAVSFQVQGHGEGPFALHDRCPMPERGAGGGIPRHSAPPLVSVASAPLPSLAQQGMQGMPSWQGKQDGLASCLDFLSR